MRSVTRGARRTLAVLTLLVSSAAFAMGVDRSTPGLRLLPMMMLAALLGCAASQLSNDVKPYVGRNFHDLVARLGKPNGTRETSGDRVYVWTVYSEGVLPNGTAPDGTSQGSTVAHYDCTLAVRVDAQDVIEDFEVEGGNAGCAAFRRHLSSR